MMAQYGYGYQNEPDTDSEFAFESDSDCDEAFEGAFTAKLQPPQQQPPPQHIKPPPTKPPSQTTPPSRTPPQAPQAPSQSQTAQPTQTQPTQTQPTKPNPGPNNQFNTNSGEIQNRKWKIKPTIRDTERKLCTKVGQDIASLSNENTDTKHSFIVAFSGGNFISTVGKMFESSGITAAIKLSKWHLFWVDDKIVSPDHAESDNKIACERYLTKLPIPQGNMNFIEHVSNPENVAIDYQRRMQELVDRKVLTLTEDGFPKFDLVVLSVGPKGNIGSLSPKGSECSETKRWVVPVTNTAPPSITFTFPVINSASKIFVVGIGNEVADVVGTAFGGTSSGETLPIQMISNEQNLTCYLDNAAASKIPK